MSKPVKDVITRDLSSRYSDQDNALWVEVVGVDGITTNEFRRALRAKHMRLEVVKTSLLRRACAGKPLSRLADALEGPAALVTGADTAIEYAKFLEEWKPKLPQLKLRGALLDGEYLDERQMPDLPTMPTKVDLQGRVVAIALTPGRNVVGAALAPGKNLAGILKAMIEKLENGESIQARSA